MGTSQPQMCLIASHAQMTLPSLPQGHGSPGSNARVQSTAAGPYSNYRPIPRGATLAHTAATPVRQLDEMKHGAYQSQPALRCDFFIATCPLTDHVACLSLVCVFARCMPGIEASWLMGPMNHGRCWQRYHYE